MIDRRHSDGGGLDFAVRSEQLFERSEGAAPELAGDGVSARHIAVDNTEQAESLSLLFELLVDAGVITSERAYSDHGDVDDSGRIQVEFSGRPVAAEPIVTTKRERVYRGFAAVSSITNRSF
jgi:hypothetical protein